MEFRKYFFQVDANFVALEREIDHWKGTKFIANMAMVGVGADCVRFVEAVLVDCGAIDPITWPPYVIEGGGAAMLEVLVRHMGSIPKLDNIWNKSHPKRPTLERGDVLLVSTGKKLHHLSILTTSPTIWHCLPKSGVCEGNVFDPLIEKYLHAVYRAKG